MDKHSLIDVFEFHGLVTSRLRNSQVKTECPFCMKEKFYIEKSTGQYNCKTCAASGNTYTFIRQLWQHSFDATSEEEYTSLVISRGNYVDQFKSWGLAKNILSDNWICPMGKDVDSFNNLTKKSFEKDSYVMFSTPGMQMGLFGLGSWKGHPTKIICEGLWDGIAVQASIDKLGWKMDVCAVPGCLTWNPSWNYLFKGHDVVIIYDNDHDKTVNDRIVYSPGLLGQRKVCKSLHKFAKSLRVASWDKSLGVNESIPDKTDIRDVLQGKVSL